jgi:hypothetical protein
MWQLMDPQWKISYISVKYTLEAETYKQTGISLIPCFYLMRLLHTTPRQCRNSLQQLHESFSNEVAPAFSLRHQNKYYPNHETLNCVQ